MSSSSLAPIALSPVSPVSAPAPVNNPSASGHGDGDGFARMLDQANPNRSPADKAPEPGSTPAGTTRDGVKERSQGSEAGTEVRNTGSNNAQHDAESASTDRSTTALARNNRSLGSAGRTSSKPQVGPGGLDPNAAASAAATLADALSGALAGLAAGADGADAADPTDSADLKDATGLDAGATVSTVALATEASAAAWDTSALLAAWVGKAHSGAAGSASDLGKPSETAAAEPALGGVDVLAAGAAKAAGVGPDSAGLDAAAKRGGQTEPGVIRSAETANNPLAAGSGELASSANATALALAAEVRSAAAGATEAGGATNPGLDINAVAAGSTNHASDTRTTDAMRAGPRAPAETAATAAAQPGSEARAQAAALAAVSDHAGVSATAANVAGQASGPRRETRIDGRTGTERSASAASSGASEATGLARTAVGRPEGGAGGAGESSGTGGTGGTGGTSEQGSSDSNNSSSNARTVSRGLALEAARGAGADAVADISSTLALAREASAASVRNGSISSSQDAAASSVNGSSSASGAVPMPGVLSWVAPAAGGAAAANVATDGRIAASPGTPEFAPQLAAQVTTFVRDGVQHAKLELNPGEMGPLTVQIQLEGNAARVHLAAENEQTRQALEQAMPQLAGSLREGGLTLSGGGVFEQPRQAQQQQAQAGGGNGNSNGNSGSRDERGGNGIGNRDATVSAVAAPVARRRMGVVDLVA
jgi:flagellar hook-length control protein FliK